MSSENEAQRDGPPETVRSLAKGLAALAPDFEPFEKGIQEAAVLLQPLTETLASLAAVAAPFVQAAARGIESESPQNPCSNGDGSPTTTVGARGHRHLECVPGREAGGGHHPNRSEPADGGRDLHSLAGCAPALGPQGLKPVAGAQSVAAGVQEFVVKQAGLSVAFLPGPDWTGTRPGSTLAPFASEGGPHVQWRSQSSDLQQPPNKARQLLPSTPNLSPL